MVAPAGGGPARRPGTSGAHERRQPELGLLGLLLVVPIAVVLAIGAGGEGSVRVLAPLVTYSLPLAAMVAFWWADWPGTLLRPAWSGWADTLLVAVGAVVLTAVGQTVVGHLDPVGIVDPSAGAGHSPTFPATMPLGGLAFVAMLQLTLVGEGWPLQRLRRRPAGLLAVGISWGVALVVFFVLVQVTSPPGSAIVARRGPVPGAELGAVLVLVAVCQVLCYVIWAGWPFTMIANRALR